MYKIQWSTRTQSDFRRLRSFLKEKNTHAANRIRPAIEKGVELLRTNPEMGTNLNDQLGRRELSIQFGKRAYILCYIPDHDAQLIRILRIWHSREKRD